MGKIIINGIDYSGGGGGGGGASSEAIAPIEEASVVTQPHPAGSLLFFDNVLYKAKTALAIGDTIITEGANANVEATDIDTELKNKINLSSTAGLIKNDGTVDQTQYVSDISGKADKVSNVTNGNFAGLDSNGNLTDSGKSSSDFKLASAHDSWSEVASKPFSSIGDSLTVTSNSLKVNTAFTQASSRSNITSGETIPTILGKLQKWYTDLKTVAFTGSYNDLSNKPMTDYTSQMAYPIDNVYPLSISGFTYSSASLYRIGNMVFLDIILHFASESISASAIVPVTFPSSIAPKYYKSQTVYGAFRTFNDGAVRANAAVVIGSDGKITIVPSTSISSSYYNICTINTFWRLV